MKKTAFILALLCFSINNISSYAEEVAYDNEFVSTNLEIIETDTALLFNGSTTVGGNLIQFYIPKIKHGQYGDYDVKGTFLENLVCSGTGTYSYSDDLLSDLLVAIMDVDSLYTMKFTMYLKDASAYDEEILLEHITAKQQGKGKYASLIIEGSHDTFGAVTIYLDQWKNSYGKYQIVYATIGETVVSGEGTWSKVGEYEQLEAVLSTQDGSQTFHVVASTGTISTTQIPTIQVESSSDKFILNGQLYILRNGVQYTLQGAVIE